MSTTSGNLLADRSAQRHVEYLERLSEELAIRGLRVRLTVPLERPPNLHVLNPDAIVFDEDIEVEFAADGGWFLWSWGERIGSAENVPGAADMVERVLYG